MLKLQSPDEISVTHRSFWKKIPAWRNVSPLEFGSYAWQLKNSILGIDSVESTLGAMCSKELIEDMRQGQTLSPMNIRVTPYIFSLINWEDGIADPIRKQFFPLATQFIQDHPNQAFDHLDEIEDSPVPMLTHRYPNKALFLPTAICPVYCAYCTRSRIVGGSTETVKKVTYGAKQDRWEDAFSYLQNTPSVEDVVISGGDAMMLNHKQIRFIGEALLSIPHIRKIRVATRAIAVCPQKILTDEAWVNAIVQLNERGRARGTRIAIHTHFTHPREITEWSVMAMQKLHAANITVRNQTVLLADVNDSVLQMSQLIRKLAAINIEPYYVYAHDMVSGCEHFRTTIAEMERLEKQLRGTTAGFDLPAFICDLPGGGGKRLVSTYDYYDRENGISVWTAPGVKPGRRFYYFDPLHKLSFGAQQRWKQKVTREAMLQAALEQTSRQRF